MSVLSRHVQNNHKDSLHFPSSCCFAPDRRRLVLPTPAKVATKTVHPSHSRHQALCNMCVWRGKKQSGQCESEGEFFFIQSLLTSYGRPVSI